MRHSLLRYTDWLERWNVRALMLLIGGLLLATVAVDMWLPLGFAGGAPYVLLCVLGLRLRSARGLVTLAIACTLLIGLGYVVSPGPAELSVMQLARANRGLALAGVWLVALVGVGTAHQASLARWAQQRQAVVRRAWAERRESAVWLIALGMLLLTIAVVDLHLPLGYAGGVPYLMAIVLALRVRSESIVIGLAVLCSVLIVVGYFASPPAVDSTVMLLARANRVLAVGGVWLTAALVNGQHRLHRQLERHAAQQSILADLARRSLLAETPEEVVALAARRCAEVFETGGPEGEGPRASATTGAMRRRDAGHRFGANRTADALFYRSLQNLTEVGCQRARRGEAIRVSEARFRAVFEHAGAGIVLLDPQGRIREANRTFCELLGCESEALRERALTDALGSERPWDVVLQSARRDGVAQFECRFRHADGTTHAARVTVSLVHDRQGEPINAIGLIEDVTESKRAQEAIRQRLDELAQVARVKTAAGVATEVVHELSQPLTAIANYVQVCRRQLRKRQLPELQHSQDLLEHALTQADRASDMIARLRKSIVRPEPNLAPIALNDVIRDLLILFEFEAERSGVQLSFAPCEPLPVIQADRGQLEQVFANLLRNAFEAVAPHACRRVTIRTATAGRDTVMVEIRDNGEGIAAQHLVNVFVPYFTTKPEGMGMGLYLSKEIIEAHGGTIAVDSTAGQGTVFNIVLLVEGMPL